MDNILKLDANLTMKAHMPITEENWSISTNCLVQNFQHRQI
jgi:hypothetical protein